MLTRIAVFQYGWMVQSYTRDLIENLAREGYLVTFFVDKKSLNSGLINLATLDIPNVEIIELSGPVNTPDGLFLRVWSRFSRLIQFRLHSIYFVINKCDYETVLGWVEVNKSEIKAFIGIEKLGLIIAGKIGQFKKIPCIYYSLELFLSDRDWGWLYRAKLHLEAKYHKKASATIIQDDLRANALFAHNGVILQERILIPVGLQTLPLSEPSWYWHEKYLLPTSHKIFLYFGDLTMSLRGLDRLVRAWKFCPKEYVLILHGNGDSASLKAYCDKEGMSNVIVSTQVVPENQIPNLIESSDVGLCIYGNDLINDRLTAFSSQKIALNLRSGVPIITSDNESYRRLFDQFPCGEAILTYSSISEVAVRVIENHSKFSRNARLAFSSIYANEVNFPKIYKYLASI